MEEEIRDIDKPNLEQASVEQQSEEGSLEEMSTEALQNKYKEIMKEYEASPSEKLQKRLSDISIIINDRAIMEASMEEPATQQQTPEPAAPESAVEQQTPESAAPEPTVEQQTPKPAAPEPTVEQQTPEPAAPEPTVEQQTPEPAAPEKPAEEINSHLFALRTTGGQEKIVLRLLENKIRAQKINIQSVLLVDNLKGYVVVEALSASDAFNAIQGIRHIRGQLRGELEFKDIEGYLVKKSTVTELAVDKTVEIIGGPFKGMKATITRVDHEKEEATVILLDAPYQLPVTVDANYLKLVQT